MKPPATRTTMTLPSLQEPEPPPKQALAHVLALIHFGPRQSMAPAHVRLPQLPEHEAPLAYLVEHKFVVHIDDNHFALTERGRRALKLVTAGSSTLDPNDAWVPLSESSGDPAYARISQGGVHLPGSITTLSPQDLSHLLRASEAFLPEHLETEAELSFISWVKELVFRNCPDNNLYGVDLDRHVHIPLESTYNRIRDLVTGEALQRDAEDQEGLALREQAEVHKRQLKDKDKEIKALQDQIQALQAQVKELEW